MSIFGCPQSNEIGSKANPLKFYLIPSQDLLGLEKTGKALKVYLEKELNMSVEVALPQNCIAASALFEPKASTTAI